MQCSLVLVLLFTSWLLGFAVLGFAMPGFTVLGFATLGFALLGFATLGFAARDVCGDSKAFQSCDIK